MTSLPPKDVPEPGSVQRIVSLRLTEIVILVRALRERAYNCRRIAAETNVLAVQFQAHEAARLLDDRADELAQANVSDQRPGDRDATKNKSSGIAGFAASDG